VLAWAWMAPNVESEGKLRFYTPEQVERLIAEARDDEDEAIYTVATEAGAPMSANVRRVLWPLWQGKDGDELVFQRRSRPGEPIVAGDLYRRFINACKRAGLPRLRTQAIRKFKIHEVQRMMGHRHITTTERDLHYAPDADGAAQLTELWGDRGGRDRAPPTAPANVVPLHRLA